MPTLAVLFGALAIVCFVVSAYMSPNVEGKLTNFGLAAFVLLLWIQ